MSFPAETILKPLLNWFVTSVAERFLPDKLLAALNKEIIDWVKDLPPDFADTIPDAILYGLRPKPSTDDHDAETACWEPVHEWLEKSDVPSANSWYAALQRRWDLVRSRYQDGGAQRIFSVDPTVVEPMLRALATRLEAACARQNDLFQPSALRKVTSIEQDVRDLKKHSLEDKSSAKENLAAIPALNQDIYDTEIEMAKDHLDQHEYLVARRILKLVEDRRWDRLSDRQRYRVLALMANTFIREGESEEAGKLLLRALTHQPNDEKARINEALAYELLLETQKAHALADGLMQEFPHSGHAAAVWIRTSPDDADDVINKIPAYLHSDAEVSVAVATFAMRKSSHQIAVDFSRKATVSSPEWPPAWLMLGQSLHAQGWGSAPPSDRPPLLAEARAAYTRAIELAAEQRAFYVEATARLNLGVLSDFFGEASSKEDYAKASELNPKDQTIMRRRALCLAGDGEYEQALALAQAAYDADNSADNGLLLAYCLNARTKDSDAAIARCMEIIRGISTPETLSEAVDTVVSMLLDRREFDRAKDVFSEAESRLNIVARESVRACVLLATSDRPGADAAIESAAEALDANTGRMDRYRVAFRLAHLEKFARAVEVLQTLVTPGILNPDTRMLLSCAHRAGNDDLLLRTLKRLREAGIRDFRLLHDEIALLRTYRPAEAIRILQEILQADPQNKQVRVLLSMVGIQMRRPDLICNDPGYLPSIDETLDMPVAKYTILVLLEAGHTEPAIRHAYAFLRQHFDAIDAHRAFMYLFHHRTVRTSAPPVLQPHTCVMPGSAVEVVETASQEKKWFVIEDSTDIHAELDEIGPGHALSRILIGMTVGETVTLSPSSFHERPVVISQIQSKYVFRYQNCLDEFQFRFPGENDVQLVRVKVPSAEDPTFDFSSIEKALKAQGEHIDRCLQLYREQPIPLCAVAKHTGRGLFELMGYLTGDQERVIIACAGTLEEREQAFGCFEYSTEIVVDATALFTLVLLDRVEILEKWPLRPIISTATYQLIVEMVGHRLDEPAEGYVGLTPAGKLTFRGSDQAAAARYTAKLQQLVKIIDGHCDVIPCDKLLTLEVPKRQLLTEVLGQHGAESMLLAAEPNRILWTDDHAVALFSKGECHVNRIWTQAALQIAAQKSVLTLEEFSADSAKLAAAGYWYSWWNEDILMAAAELCRYDSDAHPLRPLIAELATPGTAILVRFRIAAMAIVKMYQSPASAQNKDIFILRAMNSLSTGQDRDMIYFAMKYAINKLCLGNAAHRRDIQAVLSIWRESCPTVPSNYCDIRVANLV